MSWHKSIAYLEGVVSYGTLGVINALALHPNRYEFIIINVATILRNNYVKGIKIKNMLRSSEEDINHLVNCATMFCGESVIILFYMDTKLRDRIPVDQVRELTNPRDALDTATKAFKDFHNAPGKVRNIGDSVYLYNPIKFAHQEILSVKNRISKVSTTALISHCPIDYLLLTQDPKIEVIQSHTGGILTFKDLSMKVFNTDDIPFNNITLPVFGDKDTIKPQIKNRKKILQKAGDRFKRLSGYEIKRIMIDDYKIEARKISWL